MGGARWPGLSRYAFHDKGLGRRRGFARRAGFCAGWSVAIPAGDLPIPRRILSPRNWADAEGPGPGRRGLNWRSRFRSQPTRWRCRKKTPDLRCGTRGVTRAPRRRGRQDEPRSRGSSSLARVPGLEMGQTSSSWFGVSRQKTQWVGSQTPGSNPGRPGVGAGRPRQLLRRFPFSVSHSLVTGRLKSISILKN